jgi:hypothetical protein
MASGLSPPREMSRTGVQLPIKDDEPGDVEHTDVGYKSGSGIPGGVRATHDRHLLAQGDAEHARDLPLLRATEGDSFCSKESLTMATISRGMPSSTVGGARGASSTCFSGTASCSTCPASSA